MGKPRIPKIRELTDEEAARLGLPGTGPSTAPTKPRVHELTDEEAAALGLPSRRPAPGLDLSVPMPAVDPGRAALLGFTQGGTGGFADEIGAAGASLSYSAQNPAPKFSKAMVPSPDDTPEQAQIKDEYLRLHLKLYGPKAPTAYGPMRDRLRADVAQAAEQQPTPYALGEGLGAAATMAIPGAAPKMGANGLVNAAKVIGSGGVYGAATGIGDSTADLTKGDTAGVLRDAITGGGKGLAASTLGYGLSKAAPKLLRLAQRGGEAMAASTSRKVLANGAGSLSNLKLSDEAALQAVRSGGILPFGTTKGAALRLGDKTDAVGKVYGEILDTLEQAGVRGPDKEKLADLLMQRAAEEEIKSSAKKTVPRLFESEALNIATKPSTDGRLSIKQAEGIKQALQDQARAEYKKPGGLTMLGDAKKEIASTVRQANEEAIAAAGQAAPPNSDVAMAAESFAPVKRKYGLLAQAKAVAEKGAERGANRSAGGLSGAVAVGTGNPGPYLMSLLYNGAKERAGSTAAAAAFGTSALARALANAAERSPGRVRAGTGLAGALERALELEPPKTDVEKKRRAALEAALSRPALP